MARGRPFFGTHHLLAPAAAGRPEIALRRATERDADLLGPAIAAMDPWARLGITTPSQMSAFLGHSDDNKRCFTILADRARAGAVVVRFPWLSGPYLNLLAVLDAFQDKGIGRLALAWMEAEGAAAGARNAFLSVTAFNDAAIAFYMRNGYSEAATLRDLIKDGEDEILMRKRLA